MQRETKMEFKQIHDKLLSGLYSNLEDKIYNRDDEIDKFLSSSSYSSSVYACMLSHARQKIENGEFHLKGESDAVQDQAGTSQDLDFIVFRYFSGLLFLKVIGDFVMRVCHPDFDFLQGYQCLT